MTSNDDDRVVAQQFQKNSPDIAWFQMMMITPGPTANYKNSPGIT